MWVDTYADTGQYLRTCGNHLKPGCPNYMNTRKFIHNNDFCENKPLS